RGAVECAIATGLHHFYIYHFASWHQTDAQHGHHAISCAGRPRPLLLHQIVDQRGIGHHCLAFLRCRGGGLSLCCSLLLGTLLTLTFLLCRQLLLPLLFLALLLLPFLFLALLFLTALLLFPLLLLFALLPLLPLLQLRYSLQFGLPFLLRPLLFLALLFLARGFLTLLLFPALLGLTLFACTVGLALLLHLLVARLGIHAHQVRPDRRRLHDLNGLRMRALEQKQCDDNHNVKQHSQHKRNWITVERCHRTQKLFQWFGYQIGTGHACRLQRRHQTDEGAVAALAVPLYKHLNLGVCSNDLGNLVFDDIQR